MSPSPTLTPVTALPLETARIAADILLAALMPACADGLVAGSIRRLRPVVRDIDLVLLPIPDAPPRDLFDVQEADYDPTFSQLYAAIRPLIEGRVLYPTGGKSRQLDFVAGPGLGEAKGMKVQLWLASEGNFGNIVALRTGCKAYTQVIFSSVEEWGALLPGYRQRAGYLAYWGEVIPCRTERDYYEAANAGRTEGGIPWCEPEQRTAERAEQIRRDARRAIATPRKIEDQP